MGLFTPTGKDLFVKPEDIKNGTVEQFLQGLAKKESSGNYKALGPVISSGMYTGDRAYGKYQIMGKNVPEWSQKYLGKKLTAEQLYQDEKLQDELMKKRAQELYSKYGNWEDVASVHFTGQPLKKAGNVKDQLGTTAPKYVQDVLAFMRGDSPAVKYQSPLTPGMAGSTPVMQDQTVWNTAMQNIGQHPLIQGPLKALDLIGTTIDKGFGLPGKVTGALMTGQWNDNGVPDTFSGQVEEATTGLTGSPTAGAVAGLLGSIAQPMPGPGKVKKVEALADLIKNAKRGDLMDVVNKVTGEVEKGLKFVSDKGDGWAFVRPNQPTAIPYKWDKNKFDIVNVQKATPLTYKYDVGEKFVDEAGEKYIVHGQRDGKYLLKPDNGISNEMSFPVDEQTLSTQFKVSSGKRKLKVSPKGIQVERYSNGASGDGAGGIFYSPAGKGTKDYGKVKSTTTIYPENIFETSDQETALKVLFPKSYKQIIEKSADIDASVNDGKAGFVYMDKIIADELKKRGYDTIHYKSDRGLDGIDHLSGEQWVSLKNTNTNNFAMGALPFAPFGYDQMTKAQEDQNGKETIQLNPFQPGFLTSSQTVSKIDPPTQPPAFTEDKKRAFQGNNSMNPDGLSRMGLNPLIPGGSKPDSGTPKPAPATNKPFADQVIKPVNQTYSLRDNKIQTNDEELRQLGAVLFGEMGIRTDKLELEAGIIANTILNRSENRGKSIQEILSQPYQYQAYNDGQYKAYMDGKPQKSKDPVVKAQVEAVNKVLEQIKNGTLENKYGKVENYSHFYRDDNGKELPYGQYPIRVYTDPRLQKIEEWKTYSPKTWAKFSKAERQRIIAKSKAEKLQYLGIKTRQLTSQN